MPERTVVILCGPSGAGKTTVARQSGLEVYDKDDSRWTSEAQFVASISRLAHDPDARAVVIRSAPTSEARATAARQTGATHVYLLTAPRKELGRRITRRGRPDAAATLAGLSKWFASHDTRDGIARFPGWDAITPNASRRTDLTW